MKETKVRLRNDDLTLTPNGAVAMNEVDEALRPVWDSLVKQDFSIEEVYYLFNSAAHEFYLDEVFHYRTLNSL